MTPLHDGSNGQSNQGVPDDPNDWHRDLHWSDGGETPGDDDPWATPIDEHELERRRLEAELDHARARTVLAKRRHTELEEAMRQALHVEVRSLQEQLATLDAAHAEELARIRSEAKADATRIVAAARTQVVTKAGEPDVE